ncbi:vacuolar protein sorting-associated protein 13B isoform X2 [Drosophila novamexicana]|uniref:vacuolar protein sorting-associated protein 13B isoform X2 n=1 Tax=Drosophila novamexicana TaxID=47314 RepID=UPI0011E5F35E|nr:vacuolar protein sorting-associated protein 13B isoform X2 [Drosophila novamexicana]
MFKLESYITPILLNYVAKYVNIRDEDAQVSLWEGEVSFQNLDLRLDVLEEELNLPIELVSGHIHELSIQVPWTKLTSEPVRIEINTIEFVAKLPNEESKQRRAARLQEQRRKRTAAEAEEQQQAPTSIPAVVNKIINNINLQCHNIILKYVDDDIVVSMNVQYLNFSAADEKWQPAMVDVNPVNVFLRKLLQVSDLTICLDKRNTAGRIEVCQEPVLYRCTLELRVLRKHNVNTMSTMSTTRIGVFTKSLDINVSSMQLPMVMRLVKMLLELKPAEIEEEIFSLEAPVATPNVGGPTNLVSSDVVTTSLFSRAWNLFPSFETPPTSATVEDPVGHAFDVGVYAEELNFQLKNSELITDQAMGGIKRIRYTPILRISLGGIYYERSQLKESDWTNVRAGLSSICMEPLGVYRSEDPMDRSLVNTKEFHNERAFIDKSLFDDQYTFADRSWSSHNHDDYFARNTDEYMLFRSPVLAFDIVECRAPRPARGQASPEAQLRDLGLRVKYRVLSAGITFHFTQSFLQVKNVISDLLRPYDYTGYHAETVNDNVISPVSREEEYKNRYMTYADFEYLMGFMPMCNYKIELRDMTVKFYPRQQSDESSSAANQHRLTTTVNQSLLPYLQLRLAFAEGVICGPANPQRLVQLITHLEDKPREIIESCYNAYTFNVKNLSLSAINTTPEMGTAKLLNIPSMQVQFKSLLLPNYWRRNVAALETAEVQSELINVEFSKRELVLTTRIIPLILGYNGPQLGALAKLTAQANNSSDVIKLQTLITKVRLNYRKYHTHLAMLFSLRNMSTDVYHTMMNIRNVVLSTNKGITNKWLELQLQVPLQDSKLDSKLIPANAVCLWIESFRITLDIYLLQFLNSFENPEPCIENDLEPEFDSYSLSEKLPSNSNFSMASVPKLSQMEVNMRRLSRTNSRKISVPAETIHASTERDEKPATHVEPVKMAPKSESSGDQSIELIQLMKRLRTIVVVMEITKVRIDVCEVMLRRANKDADVEYTSIRLDRLKIKSSHADEVLRGNIRTVISVTNNAELCNWVMELKDFAVCYRLGDTTEMIVAPVRTTITLALSHKIAEKVPEALDSKSNKRSDSFIEEAKIEGQSGSKKVEWQEEPQYKAELPSTYSINVHVDMSAINIFGRHLKLMHDHYEILNAVYTSLLSLSAGSCQTHRAERRPSLEIYTGSAQNYAMLKEFLELDPNFKPTANTPDPKVKASLIFFCQWTIPRISLEVEGFCDYKHRKLLLSFEDLLLNVDRHEDFTKVTTKVENFSLNYYEAIVLDEWQLMDDFHIKMLGDNMNLPLINVVVTTVSLQDLHSKIGARDLLSERRTISELIIEVQPIEIILHVDRISEFLVSQCEVFEIMRSGSTKEVAKTQPEAVKDSITTVHDLPMVHLNSKGIFIYLPVESEKKCCSVLLLRIESIKLTPSVENPLVRQPIRPDVYNKAAELNMLSTPGSLVEDRQYELSVRRISLSSGNWLQTQKYRTEATLVNKHSNPALEWNNQTRSTELEHMDIFKDFDFITVFAPAISYDRFLVCGESVEFNCVTDFVATLNTHQIHLISCIINRVQRLRGILGQSCLETCPKSRLPAIVGSLKLSVADVQLAQSIWSQTHKSKLNKDWAKAKAKAPAFGSFADAHSSDTLLVSCQSDSGINIPKNTIGVQVPRNYTLDSQNQLGVTKQKLSYPRSVSFVAGIFALRVYDVLEEKDELKFRPLLLVTVSQPSFMSTQTPRAVITQASVFDFNIHLARSDTERDFVSYDEALNGQFSEPVFDTQPGTLGSSGIPPPLFTLKTQVDRNQHVDVDIELRKPMQLSLCESSVKLLSSDLIRIYSLLSLTPYFAQRSERPVVHTTHMRQLKLQCFNADRLHFVCDRVTVKFYDEAQSYSCSAVCLDFNANVKFTDRPQKASIKSTLGAFYVHTGDQILLHPLLIRLSADLLSESWCDQLLTSITLKLNVLHVDASIQNILHLSQARDGLDNIKTHADQEWQHFLQERPSLGQPPANPPKELLKYTPSQAEIVRSKTAQKTKIEFYQDDLRAGAFQFVYLNTDTMLPMPYQVQIIKKNYGIICWRYPQPRQMSRIHIYPVPMPVENPIHIQCRMEYFSETHETFLHYCDFELSEIASKQLTPPDRNISATIWRVVIMQSLISVNGSCFDPEEDEDLQTIESSRLEFDFRKCDNNDFILHPKVLVGCMRIDTTFQADLVPKLQLLVCCQNIKLNFLNQPDASNVLPPPLRKYYLRRITKITQTFLTVHVDDVRLHASVYTPNNYSVETDFRSRIKCLDYGCLNMLDIMEPMAFHSYLRFNSAKSLLQANFLLDKLRFNCGPCVIHTLLCSKQHWQELLQQHDVVHTLMPRCVIVNRMQTAFVFGQTGTSERIPVATQEMRPYYFCSDSHGQELTFHIEDADTHQLEVSESVPIALKFEDEHQVRHVRVGQRFLTIKLSKLSATQVYILVKGQIELVSMVPFELLTEFRTEGNPQDEQQTHLLPAKGRVSFYQDVARNADISMRLKLSSSQGKGRTGDIPLKSNNSLPWLVKVPTQLPQQFISFWVRIVREDIPLGLIDDDDLSPQRILVSIWPIFEICNLLSCELPATESSTEEQFIIAAEGGRQSLSTATTHSTEHCVKFKFPCALGPASQGEYTFMLKSIDWHKFFHYEPADWPIERTLDQLDRTLKPKWPLNDAEELRVHRPFKLLDQLDVQYRAQATREFSCTLGLEIAAWGMFINDTDLDVSICLPAAGARHLIRANCLEMLPALGGYFTIAAPVASSWISSLPICLENQTQAAGGLGRHVLLRANSYVDIVLVRCADVLRLLLEFKLEDGHRVFKLRSKFVIANFSDVTLSALPLTMDHKETASRSDVNALDFLRTIRKLESLKAKQHNNIGVSVELFHDLNAHKSKHTSDTAFVYFMCFTVAGKQDICIPVPLTLPFTRRCFNLQDGSDSIPLMISLIEKDNVYYLNVFRDTSPALIINNNTNVKLVVAQTSASGNSNVTCTSPELAGKHFEWNQLIAPFSKCYYTPPQMYANFPDVEFTMCNLSLALYSDLVACGKHKISWSKPIRTDKSWQKFIHVPNHGDIKVVICDKHRAIRFNIYYIAQQLEFSVKDLRSRLKQPESTAQPQLPEVAEEQPTRSEVEPSGCEPEHRTVDCIHFRQECEAHLTIAVRFFVKSFVFSLHTNDRDRDYLKTEVCNIYADDVMLAYDDDEDGQRVLQLQLPNLQVDNQLYSNGKYDFPVLLCAQKLYKRDSCLPKVYDLEELYRSQARGTISMITFVLYEDELQLQAVRCQLQPLRVYIEDAYLNQLLDTLVECAPSNCVYTPRVDTKRVVLDAGQIWLPEQVVAQARYIAEPLRLNSFIVEPLSLLLSVHTSSRLYIALDHSPLSFSRYEREQILTVPLRFGQSLGLHYLSGAIFGAGWVVGSLEILGSPSGLARSFTTGMRDFISMPVQGLFRGPWGFLVGITQGSASLLRNVTAGTVNSVTKLAGSVARNIDRLTLDSEHIELTEARRRARPQGFADGLTLGLTGLGISLLGAVGGLAHHTLEARSSVGVLTGLTKGIVGAITKPISGAAEMLALTGQGVLHTVGFNAMPQQVEPSVTRNVALHTSSYRIWRFLPQQLSSDQILCFQEITLLLGGHLQPALLFLTSAVLVITELKCDDLKFISPVLKVELLADRDDPSKLYLSLKPEQADDMEGMKYTNERIISFLNASRTHGPTNDTLSDLLQLHEQDQDQDEHDARRQTQCIFYIRPNLGEHLIHYLKVISQTRRS